MVLKMQQVLKEQMNQFMVLNETLKRTDGGFDKGLYGAGEFGYSMETAT
jgi:hypothetical protein